MSEGDMSSLLKKYFPIIHFIQSNYFSRGPIFVDIELSNRCNLKCRMCWFHGENGIGDKYRDSEMASEVILELIDQLAAYRPKLYFGGGEPFIREDFLTILAHAKNYALPIAFTTNGTLLNQKKIEKITELGIDAINVSIDGPEELHDIIRGHGNFRKVILCVKYLLKFKKMAKTKKPLITVNITINPLNIGHLKETIDAIRETAGDEIDFFRIHHLWFVTPGDLQAHKEAVYKALESSAPGAESHCVSPSQHHNSIVLSDEISQLKNRGKIVFFPDIQDKEIHAFYSDGYRLTKRCTAPFQAVVVKPNGDLKFCPDEWIDDYVLGNIRDDRFETIWNNQKARHFRSVIFWKKSFPGCKRCTWMHCF
jgi:radical SAM protein with 4Fe4S-binding SPASM domain